MILLFHDGKIHDIIRDAQIDPNGVMNKSGTNYDDLNITNTTAQQEAFASYYSSIISTLKSRVHVVNASNLTGTSSMKVQEIDELDSLSELEDVVNDNKAARKSYLLLLTSNGFVYDRFGINTDIDGKPYGYNFDEKEYQEMSDAYNTITSYLDNCALESSTLLETLLQILEDYLVINTGAAIGAGAGGDPRQDRGAGISTQGAFEGPKRQIARQEKH
jgi:hypothetical protein